MASDADPCASKASSPAHRPSRSRAARSGLGPRRRRRRWRLLRGQGRRRRRLDRRCDGLRGVIAPLMPVMQPRQVEPQFADKVAHRPDRHRLANPRRWNRCHRLANRRRRQRVVKHVVDHWRRDRCHRLAHRRQRRPLQIRSLVGSGTCLAGPGNCHQGRQAENHCHIAHKPRTAHRKSPSKHEPRNQIVGNGNAHATTCACGFRGKGRLRAGRQCVLRSARGSRLDRPSTEEAQPLIRGRGHERRLPRWAGPALAPRMPGAIR